MSSNQDDQKSAEEAPIDPKAHEIRQKFERVDPKVIDQMTPEQIRQRTPNRADAAMQQRLQDYAYKRCKPQLDNFAECTKDKLFSIIFQCRDEQHALNECVGRYLNEDNLTKMRRAYFKGELMKKYTHTELTHELEKRLQQQQQDQNNATQQQEKAQQ